MAPGLSVIPPFLVSLAVAHNQFDLAKWLYDEKKQPLCKAHETAATRGHLAILEWLHQTEPQVENTDICSFAASSGRLDALRWAHWNSKICVYATMGGSIDCLDYARRHGCPLSEKYLKVYDCPTPDS